MRAGHYFVIFIDIKGESSCLFFLGSNPLSFFPLHSVLSKNQTVTEGNKGLLVETIRSIAEILIWGDQACIVRL